MLFVLAQVLDLDGHVVGDFGKFAVKRFDKLHRVADAVEKIRIAKRNVLRARRHLAANIFKHDIAADDSKDAFVHRHNRTMPAKMLAAAAGFRRTDDAVAIAGNDEVRILLDRRHS